MILLSLLILPCLTKPLIVLDKASLVKNKVFANEAIDLKVMHF